MWIRLRLDIAWLDLALGVLACGSARDRCALEQQAERCWSGAGEAVVCLSIRSGFDLLLSSLRLPPRSEVLLSALTVPDMAWIAEHHNLVPVPVDLVENGVTLCLKSLQKAITPTADVLVVAQLFGARTTMEPILQVAR